MPKRGLSPVNECEVVILIRRKKLIDQPDKDFLVFAQVLQHSAAIHEARQIPITTKNVQLSGYFLELVFCIERTE